MTSRSPGPEPAARAPETAAEVASLILAMADRDLAFVIRFVGESQQTLLQHFHLVIEEGLRRRGIVYGDHPLLRPMVETHARELADFVQHGISLKHQFGLQAVEHPSQSLALLRMDLWDSLRAHIGEAETHVLENPRGLSAILDEVHAFRAQQSGGAGS